MVYSPSNDLAVLPVAILETAENIPSQVSTSMSEISISVLAESAVQITWDFGMIQNPSIYNDSLIRLMYTAVILDTHSSITDLELSGSSFLSDTLIAQVVVNVTIVEPVLIIEATTLVSQQWKWIHGMQFNLISIIGIAVL